MSFFLEPLILSCELWQFIIPSTLTTHTKLDI